MGVVDVNGFSKCDMTFNEIIFQGNINNSMAEGVTWRYLKAHNLIMILVPICVFANWKKLAFS